MTEEVIVEVPKDKGNESSASDIVAPKEREGIQPEAPRAPESARERVEGKYQELLSRVMPTKKVSPMDDDHEDTVILDAKHISALTDEASKVQKLLDLAQTKGVVHAVKVARSLKDYYTLDMMHDQLSDKLYQGLLEKGLIEKE